MDTEAQVDECVHYWILSRPNGPISLGICKNCGAEYDFPNSESQDGWKKQANNKATYNRTKRSIRSPTGGTNS